VSVKMLTMDQHQPLHATYGVSDCCLCRVERERDALRADLAEAMAILEHVTGAYDREWVVQRARALVERRKGKAC
jgi:hypothetical protein